MQHMVSRDFGVPRLMPFAAFHFAKYRPAPAVQSYLSPELQHLLLLLFCELHDFSAEEKQKEKQQQQRR